jgi:hypothetical protein
MNPEARNAATREPRGLLSAGCSSSSPVAADFQFGKNSTSALGLGWGATREIRCQLRDNKLLEDIGDSHFPNPDQCVREH